MNQQLESTFLTAIGQDQQKLLRICSVYAEDDDDKKDLFQESLIHIWQSMPSFEAKSSISTWMFRITLNVCMRLQPAFPIFAKAETEFFYKVVDAQLTFTPNKEGTATESVTLHQGGQNIVGKKL